VETVLYTLDAGQSTVVAQAFATGLLAGFGHSPKIAVRTFSGETRFVPDTFADASVRAVAQLQSLEVLDEMKEKDRRELERTMFDEVLEVHTYSEAVFESTSITPTRVAEGRYRVRVVGDLTLHGTTRHGIWILAQVTVHGDELHAKGDFKIKQIDYGIKRVSIAAGALKLKDEVDVTFDIVGRSASR
jgi:polyisoprenoid-binding protein YceI